GAVIRGIEPDWVGVWETEPGAACGADGLGCLRLAVDRAGSGTVTWLSPAEPAGPFAAATDPSVGYPPGLDPGGYATAAASPLSGVAYRVLDGWVDGETLSFWVSPVDLWTDWCELASPFAVTAGPSGIDYRCAPGGVTTPDVDPGRQALCGSSCLLPDNCETPLCSCDRSGCRAALQNEAIPFTVRRTQGSRLVGAFSPARRATAIAFELEGVSR
ncbi:MAG: hypothetical protein FJ104_15175, partial [Deltaproteobacteria bacterium]|nr:hypothetical protein [Deltaproteobacteria bacterium]